MPLSLNDTGAIVGYYQGADFVGHAFLRSKTSGGPGTIGTPACGALDVSANVRVNQGPFTYQYPTTYEYSETVTVTNTSSFPLPEPLYVVIDNLPTGVIIEGNQLITHCGSPNGSYLILLTVAYPQKLPPGKTGGIPLLFFSPNPVGNIPYTTRVFSGMPNQ